MTYDKLINQILVRMGNRMGLKKIAEETVEIVKVELEEDIFHPYFLLSENQYFDCVIDEARIPVPEKFLAEYENGALWIEVEGVFKQLLKTTPDLWADRSAGVPTHYAQMGEYFRLFPTPDKAYLIRTFNYVGTDLLTNTSNPWLTDGATWLIWATVALLAQSGRDKNWTTFEGRATNARLTLEAKTTERENVNLEMNMGSI